MKKYREYIRFTFLIVMLETLLVFVLALRDEWVETAYPFRDASLVLLGIWFFGMICLFIKKGELKKALSQALRICNIALCSVLLVIFSICALCAAHPYQGGFELSTSLFSGKQVLLFVPHQDDDINLLGGLIEQYTEAGSEISVVFTTNGDRYGTSETRAKEAVKVLSTLGVPQENIYYLGFGDQWVPQTFDGEEIQHIYNSPDPDLVWTSLYGATETYGTESIDCYLDLPYTRNNYLFAIQSIIQERMPDTIFAVDFDSHIDHKSATLFFDEALCNVLTATPDYHPTVYKGFCYGTAWNATDDFFKSTNLVSTVQPDSDTWRAASFGYNWENRLRFPMSRTNLNWVLTNNSVYRSLNQYRSQYANLQSIRILNGDKVFWHRRTDSLLYNAVILAGSEETTLLNDFKLKDFILTPDDPVGNSAVLPLANQTVSITLAAPAAVNSVYLYDNPDGSANILDGYLRFPDGSTVPFGALEEDGSPTIISFPEKQISQFEIVVTEVTGEAAGLCEVEAFYDVPDTQEEDTFLMAVDFEDNFVYDYLLADTTTAFRIGSYPAEKQLGEADVTLTFTSNGKASCHWEDDLLIVDCPDGVRCTITISDGENSTTFTVSNPGSIRSLYLQLLRWFDKLLLNIKVLVYAIVHYLIYLKSVIL